MKRDSYLDKLVSLMWNGQIKVITGVRRCGKSYLLKTIFRDYLLSQGVKERDILILNLDEADFARFRNPLELTEHVKKWAKSSKKRRYLFIDEIQECESVDNPYLPKGAKITFYDALNSFLHIPNLDIYVTGSNSKMLSTDILTEFRGRGDEVRLHPLTFAEYYEAFGGDKEEAFQTYLRYGGMPLAVLRKDDAAKEEYLKGLFEEVYLKDIIDRKKVERVDVLGAVTDLLASSLGSLTNPNNIANSLNTTYKYDTSINTVAAYVEHLKDAFLFSEARRYDIKGKSYFDYPNKYYCEDVGLRNARTMFRHQEVTHLMENVIYNELIARGYSVDVGVVYSWEKNKNGSSIKIAREIDFVVNRRDERLYIQSAYALEGEGKAESEFKPFSLTGDNFRKIIVRHDTGKSWYDENGVFNTNVIDFLLTGNGL